MRAAKISAILRKSGGIGSLAEEGRAIRRIPKKPRGSLHSTSSFLSPTTRRTRYSRKGEFALVQTTDASQRDNPSVEGCHLTAVVVKRALSSNQAALE